jgi:hypothetical protein
MFDLVVEADVVGVRIEFGARIFAKAWLPLIVNATEIKSSDVAFDIACSSPVLFGPHQSDTFAASILERSQQRYFFSLRVLVGVAMPFWPPPRAADGPAAALPQMPPP